MTSEEFWNDWFETLYYNNPEVSTDDGLKEKLIQYSRIEKDHVIWTGMTNNSGQPKLKSPSNKDKELTIKILLMRESDARHCTRLKNKCIYSICGIKRCINPSHFKVMKHGQKYLHEDAKKLLQELMEKYPLNYLSRYYDINVQRLKRIKNNENE